MAIYFDLTIKVLVVKCLLVQKMETATRVRTPYEVVGISRYTNTIAKGENPTILSKESSILGIEKENRQRRKKTLNLNPLGST